MDQAEPVGDLEFSLGYVLKQVHTSLRTAMDDALRPLDLTVPQYACLELIGQQGGLSNSALSRRAFVTRQSMNLVVRRLQDRGLLSRPESAEQGRELPATLTRDGRAVLREASVLVRAAEKHIFAPLTGQQQTRMRKDLAACVVPNAVS